MNILPLPMKNAPSGNTCPVSQVITTFCDVMQKLAMHRTVEDWKMRKRKTSEWHP